MYICYNNYNTCFFYFTLRDYAPRTKNAKRNGAKSKLGKCYDYEPYFGPDTSQHRSG